MHKLAGPLDLASIQIESRKGKAIPVLVEAGDGSTKPTTDIEHTLAGLDGGLVQHQSGQGFSGLRKLLKGRPLGGVGILPVTPVHMVAKAALKLGISRRKSLQNLVEIGEGRGWHGEAVEGIQQINDHPNQ